jgi:hypothetical protein
MTEPTNPAPAYEPPIVEELDITQGPVETAAGVVKAAASL